MNDTVFVDTHERLDVVNEDLKLIQNKNGLTFGTDAYLLAAYMSETHAEIAVELGGGTGIISLLCATRNRAKQIYCAEIQPEFYELIMRNTGLNSLDGKILPLCVDIRNLSPATIGAEADIVFSNPPYMKTESGKRNQTDEKYIARHEVCGSIYDFCHAASRLLKFGGKFFCVWRPDRLSDLMDALRTNRLEPKRMTFVHADRATPPSMVLIEAKKGAAPSLIMTRPLMLYSSEACENSTRRPSEDLLTIYENCSFSEFFKRKG